MALTPEQQQALDELAALMAANAQAGAPPTGAPPASQPDWLETWLGISRSDLRQSVMGLLDRKDALQGRLLDHFEANPLDAVLEFIGISAWAFYLAEKDHNPKIRTYLDAFYYIATCASVGYADIFAITQTGRAIAALVMLVGPAMAARSTERPNQGHLQKEK